MERVFTIIVNDKNLLLLKDLNNKWTSVDAEFLNTDSNYTESIIREVINSTCLNIKSIENTRCLVQKYYLDKPCNYHIYIAYVTNNDVILNDNYIDYKWVDKEEFFNDIDFDDVEYLKTKLQNYLIF